MDERTWLSNYASEMRRWDEMTQRDEEPTPNEQVYHSVVLEALAHAAKPMIEKGSRVVVDRDVEHLVAWLDDGISTPPGESGSEG